MLQQFELQRERAGRHTELAAVDGDRRRAPDIGSDDLLASRDGRDLLPLSNAVNG